MHNENLRRISRLWPLLALALLSATYLSAQTQNGNILGTVRDTTGAVIPNVNLELEEQQTGLKRTTVSEGDGSYRFALVPLGNYTITAEQTGFRKYINRDIGLT